ncbi:unnamed protein product, partial [Symbiodinium pilosum]
WATLAACFLLASGAGTHDSHVAEDGKNDTLHCAEEHAGHHGISGIWFGCADDYELEFFEEVTVVILVSLTLMVEVLTHKLYHIAEHSSVTGLTQEEHAAHDLEKKSLEPLWLVFFNRVTAEFTVLGIL